MEHQENMSSRFSKNSEVSAPGLLEDCEEMFFFYITYLICVSNAYDLEDDIRILLNTTYVILILLNTTYMLHICYIITAKQHICYINTAKHYIL